MNGVWILFDGKGKEVKRVPEPDQSIVFLDNDSETLTIETNGRLMPPASESPNQILEIVRTKSFGIPSRQLFINESKSHFGIPSRVLHIDSNVILGERLCACGADITRMGFDKDGAARTGNVPGGDMCLSCSKKP